MPFPHISDAIEDDGVAGRMLLDQIAERRILDAIERGEFDNLPGEGKPLVLDDDPIVPEELRMAYHVLKNAGYVPPELRLHKEVRELEDLLDAISDHLEKSQAMRRIALLRTRLEESRKPVLGAGRYRSRLMAILGGLRMR